MSIILLEQGGFLLLEDSNGEIVGGESAALLSVSDNQDGTGATATLSGCDSDVTYTLYAARTGTKNWVEVGSRLGNGDIEADLSNGEYIFQVVGPSTVGQIAHCWVSTGSVFRTRTKNRTAQSLLRTLSGNGTSRSKGIQVIFSQPNEDDVVIWVMDLDFEQSTSMREGMLTDQMECRFLVPRQTGFPPSEWKTGARITHNDVEYQVQDVNGSIDLSASFELICSRNTVTPEY